MRLRLQFCSIWIQEHYNTRLFRTKLTLCGECLSYLFKLSVIEMFVKLTRFIQNCVRTKLWVKPLTTGPLTSVTGILASSGFSSARAARSLSSVIMERRAGGGAALLPAAPAPRHTQSNCEQLSSAHPPRP